jgi:hypothetical protein
MQRGALRRSPASLAGDDLVRILDAAQRAHDHGLDDAALFDRRGEFVELCIRIIASRIARIGPEIFDRHAPLIAGTIRRRRRFGADVAHERRQPATKSRSALVWHRRSSRIVLHHAAPCC